MSGPARSVAVLVAALAVVGLAAFVASRGGPSRPTTIEDRVHEIGAGLRCPVCLNLSVADSPSKLAGEMRAEIETQLQVGRSPEQIREFFIDRYGEWILLEPPRRGLNLVPWAVPVVGLIAGVTLWGVFVRRRSPTTDHQATEGERDRIDHELADLQERG